MLLQRARNAERCHFDNATQPKEPSLSESERADTAGFFREMLRVLPLLGVRVFEKPTPVATPGVSSPSGPTSPTQADDRDTVVVPAQEEGFRNVFLGQNCWYSKEREAKLTLRLERAATPTPTADRVFGL